MKKLLAGLFAVTVLFLASSVAGRADTYNPNPSAGSGYWVPPDDSQQPPPYAYGPAPSYYPPPYYAAAPPPYYYGPAPGYYGPAYYGSGPGVRIYLPGLFFGFGFHGHHR